jgi:acetyltransferase-like isoleucine patch superfamily enzyme
MALFSRKGPAKSEDPLLLIGKGFRRMWNTLVNAIFPFESAGCDLWIHYTAKLDRSTAHRIKLGNHVRLRNDVRLQVLAPLDEKGGPVIVMDDSSDIGPQSSICAKNSIHLERDVTLAQSVLIMDHNPAHENIAVPIKDQGVTEGGRIRIEKGCFIGQGAVILCDRGELVLGRNCVVAANSLVTRSFPPYCLIAGNPAKLVQQFDPEKKEWVLGGARTKEIKSAS